MLNKTKKLDIIFVATLFLNDNFEYFSGGAEIHLKSVCNIVKINRKILVIQMSKSHDNLVIEKDGITVLFIKAKNIFSFKIKLRFVLKDLNTKIVHFNYIELSNYIQKKKSIVYSGTFHGTAWDFPTNNFPEIYVNNTIVFRIASKIKKMLMIKEQNQSIKKLDKILSVDSSLLRYTQQFFSNERDKVDVIYNFVDTKKFSSSCKRELNINTRKFIILYPRNISFARGVHLLVPLALKLKEYGLRFEIKIVGAGIEQIGGNKYESKLLNEIKENSLNDAFIFTGRLQHNEMPTIMKECDMVIIPTFFSEGTSLSCLEAMASNKIVLATNIGGLNDIIIDGYNGFLCKPEADEIAEKIKYIHINFNALDYILDNAISIIDKVYSYDVWVVKVEKYFKSLENEIPENFKN